MTNPQALSDTMVEVVFPVHGQSLPRDHAEVLQRALCKEFPWLHTEVLAAVQPVRLVAGTEPQALLSGRTRLVLRLGSQRAHELMALTGLDIEVDGHRLRLSAPHLHALLPHATLYSYKVAAESADEVAFMAAVESELARLEIGGERVCGKRHRMEVSGRAVDTFSLMLHALPPDQSLRLQQVGLGPHRLLGCGIFVPHKSAAAV